MSKMKFRHFVVIVSLFILGAASLASAEPIKIGAGKPGGGYDRWASEAAQYLKTSGNMEVEISNLEGSEEITSKLCSGEINLAPTQIDAPYTKKDICTLEIIGSYGQEHAVLFTKEDSGLKSIRDLNKSTPVLVDTTGSGTDLMFRNMQAIEKQHGRKDEWSDAPAINSTLLSADGKYASGQIKAVMMVVRDTDPKLVSMIEKGWIIINIRDKDIDDLKFNGKPLYQKGSIDLGLFAFSSKDRGDTYIVESVIAANRQWLSTLSSQEQAAIYTAASR